MCQVKFHVDIQSGSRLQLIPVSENELSETTNFVYNFVKETKTSEQLCLVTCLTNSQLCL